MITGTGRRALRHLAPILFIGAISCSFDVPCRSGGPFDLVIFNGDVIDGTGRRAFRGAVGVCGDRIAFVGERPPGRRSRREIDARGFVIAPGFIDMLGQSELNILRLPQAISKVTQGITTEVTGEVESVWPNTSPLMARSALRALPWQSLDEYFSVLVSRGSAINLTTFVAAGSVRRAVLGDASRRPTAAELDRMGDLVDAAMKDGAVGFAAALLSPPASLYTTAELSYLAGRASRFGGAYATHLRSESDSVAGAVREAIMIGRDGRTRVQIHHLKVAGHLNWGRMDSLTSLIDAARAAGVEVGADIYPYTVSSTGLAAILPGWALAGGIDSASQRLGDEAVRVRLRQDPQLQAIRPSAVQIISVRSPELQIYVGKRVDEIARMRHESSIDAMLDLIAVDSGGPAALFFSMDEADLRSAMRRPWVSVGLDAGVVAPIPGAGGHPRAFGTIPRILGRYVREDSVLSLEDAVRRMTSLAAHQAGLDGRGELRIGKYADIVVFDPKTIIDHATFDDPRALSTGVYEVVVNGVPTLLNGQLTGAFPGRPLRGPGFSPRRHWMRSIISRMARWP